jgi:hypothetical protein
MKVRDQLSLADERGGLHIGAMGKMRARLPLALGSALMASCQSVSAGNSGPVTLGTACDLSANVDPCNASGYVCTPDDNSPLGGSCEYAEYSDPCLSTIGCDPDAGDLKCYEFLGADSGPEPLCGTPCVVPTDCIDATSACYQAYLGDGGLVGACTLNPCPNAYQSCPVGDGGVGTCIPFEGLDYYVCSQSGPVPLNSPCSQTIVDGGEYLCQANDLCIDNTQDGVTWCAASCGGSLSCPASTTCVPEYVFCLTPCNSPSNCTTPFGCLDLYDSSGNSVGNYCIASDAGVTGE